ncbi:UDP-4-amino-4,6-dideoxy-N-acetyl-beta-L-altrosamine N-acetyltransferase [Janthinobacterium lividum]|uniref:UDP-4-amino-4, 6-dideoxy-N-acetyl-beta-L-altrosamine N-acetyltransferase n=1 Tax=Janthinobacterium sp. LB2P10 TaxID=3424194 RepID=UPI00028A1F48
MPSFVDYSLRKIKPSDRDLLRNWRNKDIIRKNMYTDHIIGDLEHNKWFEKALLDTINQYFVFEYQARPVGFVSFTKVNVSDRRSDWAFYLGETDVPKGSGSAMEYFALVQAFEVLNFRKLCCEVFSFNQLVLNLHKKFGFQQEGFFKQHMKKSESFQDVVALALFDTEWAASKNTLFNRCFR